MPIIQVEMFEGRTVDQKRDMVKKVTDAVCGALDVPAEAVTIIIRDMARQDFAKAGQLWVDREG